MIGATGYSILSFACAAAVVCHCAQLPHLFVEDSACPTAERRSDRAADRGALRCAERAVLRLVEAHVGTEASRRQSASASFRIIFI
jgi:hypothetical protein